MMYTLTFELEGLPKMMNSGKGQSRNWRAAYEAKKAWKNKTIAAVFPRRPDEPLKKARLVFTRFSSVRPDNDGLVAGFKPIQDGLVDGLILEDDDHENIGFPTYLWEHAPNKQGKIRVTVEELPCPTE